MIRWLDGEGDAALPLPAVRIVRAEDARERLRLHARFAAQALGVDAAGLVLAYDAQGRPVLRPPRGLCLSRAARGEVALLGLGRTAIGVDIELVDAGLEPVWSVLSPGETTLLRALRGEERAVAFAAAWAAKEAYLKMTGDGLRRDPAMIALVREAQAAFIVDGPARQPVSLRRHGRFMLAAVAAS